MKRRAYLAGLLATIGAGCSSMSNQSKTSTTNTTTTKTTVATTTTTTTREPTSTTSETTSTTEKETTRTRRPGAREQIEAARAHISTAMELYRPLNGTILDVTLTSKDPEWKTIREECREALEEVEDARTNPREDQVPILDDLEASANFLYNVVRVHWLYDDAWTQLQRLVNHTYQLNSDEVEGARGLFNHHMGNAETTMETVLEIEPEVAESVPELTPALVSGKQTQFENIRDDLTRLNDTMKDVHTGLASLKDGWQSYIEPRFETAYQSWENSVSALGAAHDRVSHEWVRDLSGTATSVGNVIDATIPGVEYLRQSALAGADGNATTREAMLENAQDEFNGSVAASRIPIVETIATA